MEAARAAGVREMKGKKIQIDRKEIRFEVLFLTLIGLFLFAWAVIQPVTFSPDEQMRYKVVEYLFRHNALPHGGDPEVLDKSWGISYAFYPMLSYMVSYSGKDGGSAVRSRDGVLYFEDRETIFQGCV